MKPTILVLAEVYLPGYLAGGPVRSLANLVAQLSGDFIWKIITADRDFRSSQPYLGIEVGRWVRVGEADVFYASPHWLAPRRFCELLNNTPHDLLYLNSFFSPRFSILPLFARKFGAFPSRTTLIAPRGEFSAGALSLKWWKKKPYVSLARATRTYADLNWHASTEEEAADITRVMGVNSKKLFVAKNLGQLQSYSVSDPSARIDDSLHVCFLSRISRMKNLHFALRVVGMASRPINFTIYGPKEDARYWRECEHLIDALPQHVTVTYAGAVPHESVLPELSKHDLFLLPTLGENYGHVLIEAWMAGLPVLVSDQTPWRRLESKGVGWDLPLDRPELFAEIIDRWASAGLLHRADTRRKCVDFGRVHAHSKERVEENLAMLSALTNAAANCDCDKDSSVQKGRSN